ncbi:MAG: hypothetical protein HY010_05440 [Acidobacteria bacterium]|nr:hypothetical protein [Acidobacteriota bacterium]
MALSGSALGLAYSLTSCGGGSSSIAPPPPPPPPPSDDEFLDQIESAIFKFFWEQASSTTGQVKDRALAAGNDSRTVSSIAATGFGLTALCIGHKRGYGDATQIKDRVTTTLDYLLNQLFHQNGFFYHFIDMNTGARAFNSEVSSIDTAILLCGVLTCRQYFQDAQIQSLATQIYDRVNWTWMLNGGTTFSMGWTPESGFITARWDTYSELMMLYMLGIGATNNAVPASSWDAIARPIFNYQGLTYITNLFAPLFIHQYSHAWIDFRNKQDKYANYFNNSVTATQAHKAFCLSLQGQFSDYKSNQWGITASDSVNGYTAWGGPPQMGAIDGTIVPCAAGGSLPFAPSDCLAVLRNIRTAFPRTWQRYGYVDAFNPLSNWYDPDVIGIDVGITMLMAENQRSQFVWNTFMTNPEIQKALGLVQLA